MSHSKTIDDGGPAFPIGTFEDRQGMSLRDHFATHAPVTFEMACSAIKMSTVSVRLHCPEERGEVFSAMGALCYAYADAMIAARRAALSSTEDV